jgi:hypothetical protein
MKKLIGVEHNNYFDPFERKPWYRSLYENIKYIINIITSRRKKYKSFYPGRYYRGNKFTITDTSLQYKSILTGNCSAYIANIHSVEIKPICTGLSSLNIMYKNFVLFYINMPNDWAKESKEWLTKNIETLSKNNQII